MNISVMGGGNIGTLLAADCAHAGHAVTVCASDAERWSRTIDVLRPDGTLDFSARLRDATADIAEAMCDAELVWVTYPVDRLAALAAKMLAFVRPGLLIGLTPGACAEFFFAEHVRRGCTLIGLQRVHSIARVKERGRSVYALGRKPRLQAATVPCGAAGDAASLVEGLLGVPTEALPTYLVETLTPSNPVLHTSRLRTMLRDWAPQSSFDHNVLFYEEWTDDASRLLFAMDAEVQALCRALPLDLGGVQPLPAYYESPTPESLTRKIAGIPAFRGLTSPLSEEAPGRWVPDFSSRYFTADFAFGLDAIVRIGHLAEVDMPHCEETLSWYRELSGDGSHAAEIPGTCDALLSLYR